MIISKYIESEINLANIHGDVFIYLTKNIYFYSGMVYNIR